MEQNIEITLVSRKISKQCMDGFSRIYSGGYLQIIHFWNLSGGWGWHHCSRELCVCCVNVDCECRINRGFSFCLPAEDKRERESCPVLFVWDCVSDHVSSLTFLLFCFGFHQYKPCRTKGFQLFPNKLQTCDSVSSTDLMITCTPNTQPSLLIFQNYVESCMLAKDG